MKIEFEIQQIGKFFHVKNIFETSKSNRRDVYVCKIETTEKIFRKILFVEFWKSGKVQIMIPTVKNDAEFKTWKYDEKDDEKDVNEVIFLRKHIFGKIHIWKEDDYGSWFKKVLKND